MKVPKLYRYLWTDSADLQVYPIASFCHKRVGLVFALQNYPDMIFPNANKRLFTRNWMLFQKIRVPNPPPLGAPTLICSHKTIINSALYTKFARFRMTVSFVFVINSVNANNEGLLVYFSGIRSALISWYIGHTKSTCTYKSIINF